MSDPFNGIRRFFRELKRRNIYKVAVAYAITGWILIQIATNVFPALEMPEWTTKFVILLVLIGFPIALVFAWAFEITPEGLKWTRDVPPEESITHHTGRKLYYWIIGLLSLAIVLMAIERIWWAGTYTSGDTSLSRQDSASVAVLPFQVSGSGAEEWRDGMVTMLSTGLDGAGGLRAIADRTIFARWKQHTKEKSGVTKQEALAVARRLGASYAVIGSAVELGRHLKFVADVHATASGDRLRRLMVRGAPDSVTALSNSLTRKILGVLLKRSEEGLPSVDLQRLTTRSLPALKSYLEGERHYRAGNYKEAITDYKQAIRRDSSFALPYVRLSSSIGWLKGGYETGEKYLAKAHKLSHRLRARERRVIQALNLAHHDNATAAADSLRKLTRQYPDDPWIWYKYGELCMHNIVPNRYQEADGAFSKAIELDPGVAPYYVHHVELAMTLHRDSLLTARRLAAEPETPYNSKAFHRLARDLVFGSPNQRQQILNRLDTMTVKEDEQETLISGLNLSLQHPTAGDLQEQVFLRLLQREFLPNRDYVEWRLALNSHERGQIRKAHTYLVNYRIESWQNCLAAGAISLGYPIPDSLQGQFTTLSQNKEKIGPFDLLCLGFYHIEQGRGEKVPALIRQIRENAAQRNFAEDEIWRKKAIFELRGYRAWEKGNLEDAVTYWEKQNITRISGAIRRGDLYRQMERLKKAEGWYRAAWEHPVAHERLGQLYEQMDKPEKAAAAYRRFIEGWQNADPELQDRVKRARERLQKLTTSEGKATKEVL